MRARQPLGEAAALPAPGPHGGDGPAVAAALGLEPGELLDLSLTLNPFAPPLSGLLRRHLDSLSHYPDPAAATGIVAEALGCAPGQLLLTNGAAEAIALVARKLGRAKVEEPEFSLWRRHLGLVDPAGPRVRSDPHSPSGRLARPGEAAAAWDEAFYQMATGRWSSGRWQEGSYVIGSFTKVFACPGLRLGYVVAPGEEEAEELRRAQPLWSVSSLALAAVAELVQGAQLEAWAGLLSSARSKLAGLLRSAGLEVEEAEAPWVLVRAPGLRERLARHAVLVRDCSSFGLVGTYRVAVPGPEGLDRLAAALERSA